MKRRLFCFVHFIALMVAIVATSSSSWAQSATGRAAGAESSRSVLQAASTDSASSPEMQRLERAFGGAWSTSESFARNEFYPNGAERTGTARFKVATGGTSIIEEVHSDGSAGRLDFMVVIWWDSDAKTYKFFTCGNGGSDPCKIRGNAYWDGDAFVNDYDLTIRGAKKKWRDTFSEITPKSFTLVAAMESSDGKAMQPMITTTYRRN